MVLFLNSAGSMIWYELIHTNDTIVIAKQKMQLQVTELHCIFLHMRATCKYIATICTV